MGAMTFNTLPLADRRMFDLGIVDRFVYLGGCLPMTHGAQRPPRFLEQILSLSAMGVMAFGATLFGRGVQIFQLKILFAIIMAFKAEGAAIHRRDQQGRVCRRVGAMTGDTISLLNRRMLRILHEHIWVMTIQTKSTEGITIIFQLITIS